MTSLLGTEESALPPLRSSAVVTADMLAAFARDGHVKVPGLASPDEVAAYAGVIQRAAMRYNIETRPLADRDTYGKAFLQIMNLWRTDEEVARFVLARRYAEVAARLLGVESVRIYHDQALFKEPGGGPTPYHQDHYYWPIEGGGAITMWMPLVDVPAHVGSMSFVSGSHTLGFLGEYEISDASEAVFAALIADTGLPVETHGAMAAGDATFHHGWTLHGAPPNPTAAMRSVMTVIYVDAASRVVEPTTDARRKDLASWLPGLNPGDLVASPLNPVVF